MDVFKLKEEEGKRSVYLKDLVDSSYFHLQVGIDVLLV
jgi:hypothetical protein